MPEESQAPTATPRGSTGSPASWELILMIGAALVLIGSFLPFVKIPEGALGDGSPGFDWSAWSNAFSLFPVTLLVVLYAVAAAGQVALARFANATLSDRVANFSWSEFRLLFGALATLTMIGYLARQWPEGGIDRGIGVYLMTLGAIAMLVGAVMERRQSTSPTGSRRLDGPHPPTPGDIAVMVAGGAILLGSFLTIYSSDGDGANAWQEGFFPLFTVPAAIGVAMAAQVALTTFRGAGMPDRILGIEWNKVHLAFGSYVALMMLGFLVGRFFFSIEGEAVPEPDKGVGLWLMVLAAIGLAVGAVMRDREPASTPPA